MHKDGLSVGRMNMHLSSNFPLVPIAPSLLYQNSHLDMLSHYFELPALFLCIVNTSLRMVVRRSFFFPFSF